MGSEPEFILPRGVWALHFGASHEASPVDVDSVRVGGLN